MEENKPVNEKVEQNDLPKEENKKIILIIEDEDISYDILSTMLKENYEIKRAKNGEEGLQIIRKDAKELSLVLLDLMMPVMDGFMVLKSKAAERRIANIPVIVLTSEKKMEVEAFKLGAIDFIKKPFESADVIQARVNRIVDLYERNHIQTIDEDAPAIRIVDLYKSYGPKEVLKGLNLEVYKGELFGFIGRNGIGKSTTIDCVIGVKKFDAGDIEI